MKELISEILKKLEKSAYIDPSEHLYDSIKTIKRHLEDDNLEYYIDDFLWGLESSNVLDVDGVVGECSKLIHDFKNNMTFSEYMKNDRYKIINESTSKHCCFAYTIIDTETENPMCETFDKEEAEIICDALNKSHLNTNTDITSCSPTNCRHGY